MYKKLKRYYLYIKYVYKLFMKKLKADGIIEDPFVVDGSPKYICKKLKEYFSENGMTLKDVADALDVTQGAISMQLSGRPFGASIAKRWSRAFGFSINWLTTGEGPMFDRRKPANVLNSDAAEIMRPKCHVDGEIPVVPAWMFRAPNLDIYKAVMSDPTVETLPIVPHFPPHHLFARCPGDAMSPRICRGYLMALEPMPLEFPIISGEIYAVNTSTKGLLIRRIIDNKDGTWNCVPINQDHFDPVTIYRFDVINVFRIVGMLVPSVSNPLI